MSSALLFSAAVAASSQSAPRRAPMLPLQFGTPVPGAPFSGIRVLDFQPADGAASVQPLHGEEKIWRDSEGRTRSEIRYNGALGTVDILDFVTKTHYHWAMGDNTVTTSAIPEPRATSTPVRAEPPLDADAPKMEGVATRHGHVVRGSDEDSREVIDSWYAPSLRLSMLTIVDRPSFGKTTYRFEHVELKEPEAALFRPPQGMKDFNAKEPPPLLTASAAPPSLPAPGQTAAALPEPAYKRDPKFQAAFAAAQERVPQDEKLARWKKADKLAGEQCVECLRAIVTLQMEQQQWKDAVNSTRQMEAVATEKKDKFFAEAERGNALLKANDGQPKPDQLREAEASFRSALYLAPRSKVVVYNQGRTLAMLGRDTEAKVMFERYLEVAGEADKYRTRAEHFTENPHLAAIPMAPPFTLTTSEGEQISLDEQVGKVVLLDFWATWCGPCKETLPVIHRIAKKFAGEPLLVVSISSDSNDVAWKDFIARNDMFWTQYRDRNGALSNAYGVSAIPRFFTIDADGVLQSVKVGADADIEGDLKKLIRRAHQTEQKKAQATERAAGL